jgi:hypothetical protein
MRRSRRGTAIIAQQQRPLGLLTERDLLLRACGDHGDGNAALPVLTLMVPCPEPVFTGSTVGATLRRMCATHSWHLPLVCASGLLVGSIDIADISLWLRDRMTLLSVDAALGTSLPRND